MKVREVAPDCSATEWTADRARAGAGWHWLKRKSDGDFRAAFYDRLTISGWRVSDAIRRTTIMSETQVAKLYTYHERILHPRAK